MLYIDTNYMLHTTYDETYTAVPEAEQYFINMANDTIELYRFVPQGSVWKGVICANDFIQCTNTPLADAYQAIKREKDAYNDGYDQAILDTLEV